MNDEPKTFRVLVRGPRQSLWWDHVRSVLNDPTDREEIPEAVRLVLTRRTEVRTSALSRGEAVAIRDWAQKLEGWDEKPGLQLIRYPSQARVDWREL
jgi:hypothetical protein